MKKHLMSFGRFDQNRIGKQTIYIFPPRTARAA